MRTERVGHVARRRWLVGLFAAGLMLVPPAIAWACNPQAHINLNQTSFSPGSTITVYGSYFPGSKPISVSGPTGSTTVTTSPGGAFSTTMTAPSALGNYVISAAKLTGGIAPASFTVAVPQAATSGPTIASRPISHSSNPSNSGTPSFSVPKVHRSSTHSAAPATAPATTAPVTSAPVVAAAPVAPAAAAPTPVVAATPVVSSSPVVAATHRSATHHATTTTSKSTAPATSQLAATSDLWSGFAPGQKASLTSGAAGGMGGGGTSSALTIGIAVLAIGLIGLVGGLTGAEVRRRRLAGR